VEVVARFDRLFLIVARIFEVQAPIGKTQRHGWEQRAIIGDVEESAIRVHA